jgi:hypothetical protein
MVAVMASRPLWVALLVTALVTMLRLTGTVDSDVAWQLWIAGRLHAGAHLYRDIIEINPPLWFWMALPIDRLATLFNLRVEAVLVLTMGALVALSLAATERLIGHIAPPRRSMLLAYGALILAGMPWMHVGQREQIVLIGAVPYAALIAARREGQPVSPFLAALIGVGAALGFALKHYFLIVPALLELWLLAGQGRRWRALRPETVAIVAVGLAYAAAVLLWGRDFLTKIVPLIRLAYGVTGAPSIRHLFGPFALAGLAILGFVAVHRRLLVRRHAPLSVALAIAGLAFAAVYFIQAKGWPYHAIPLLGCASLALAALCAETATAPASLRIFAPALLALPLALAADEARTPTLPSTDLVSAVAGMRPRDSVGFLAVETAVPWSITLQRNLRYSSRYMGFWMLQAVVVSEHRAVPDPRLVALGRRIVSETVADFRCTPPRRIIVDRPRPGEPGFDILPFFLRDPDFAALMSHYKVRSRTTLETFELASALPAPAPSTCRAGL